MAVKIRLRRMGTRNKPFFRVTVSDSRRAPTGKFIETLGWYDPKQDGRNFSLNLDRIDYWLENGAQVSDTAKSLIKKARTMPVEAVVGEVKEEEVPVAAMEEAEVAEEVEEAATEEVVTEETVVAEEAPEAEVTPEAEPAPEAAPEAEVAVPEIETAPEAEPVVEEVKAEEPAEEVKAEEPAEEAAEVIAEPEADAETEIKEQA